MTKVAAEWQMAAKKENGTYCNGSQHFSSH
jgi:hypothetical protein